MNIRQIFQQHLAPTSEAPIGLHIVRASGSTLYDESGKEYLDLIGGISVCNVGHCHPKVVAAIKAQVDQYLHVMVYGETIQSPQVAYARALVARMPAPLDNVYFTNSGAEAVEGAIKLARRVTGRPRIIGAINSYHGSTTGALSLIGDEYWRQAFRPLMPGVGHYPYNSQEMIDVIDGQTACVLIETVQAEAGVVRPDIAWMQALRQRCTEQGCLLILDEIQCGFGRTGTLWGFEQMGIVPDVVLLGKALGGGMPLGAFVAAKEHMHQLASNPVLGHLTTFGGHPVCCAAGLAALQALEEEQMLTTVTEKAQLFKQLLQHPEILAVHEAGLLLAVRLRHEEKVRRTLSLALALGVFSDWFLFAPDCIRIAPPLNISNEEIAESCRRLKACLDKVSMDIGA
ncbi:MAG: aspartate aminotransferase family protein [Bacteroidetes bacterium]|nr:aspartate aminotransferase family protein [Bacteroidota bacterium]